MARDSVAQSSVAQDSMAQRGVARPSVAQDARAQDGLAQDSVAQRGVAEESVAQGSVAPDGEAQPPGTVTALRRPPVRQSVLVRSDRQHTFDTFVRTIGAWWPVTPFSAGKDQVRDVTFERRQGGRVYETWQDGTEVDWGELLVWEPPERFVMTWNMTSVLTEVELIFTALGPSLTRVAVEHRGWERLTEEQLARDCALPDGYLGGAYSEGWACILRCLAADLARGEALSRATWTKVAAPRRM